jgi:polygalacturonase
MRFALFSSVALAWRVCDPMSHGAAGTGLVFDTAAVRAAAAECGAAGGGTLLISAGKTFLTGAFNLTDNMELRVDGTLLGSPNATGYTLMDYLPWYGPDPPQKLARAAARLAPDTREWSPFVGTWYASNVSITGAGVIDGNGAAWWACAGAMSSPPCAGYPRPHGIRFVGGEGFAVSGVTIQNMPMWQVHLSWVSNVHVHDVRIVAPARAAHNTDGACAAAAAPTRRAPRCRPLLYLTSPPSPLPRTPRD